MSGVELNALMNQISSQGQSQGSEEPAESAAKTEKSASRSYSNYNREIWRVQGGILESSLVEFCVQRTRRKFIDDISKSWSLWNKIRGLTSLFSGELALETFHLNNSKIF